LLDGGRALPRGAAGKISAVYFDRLERRDEAMLLEHWTGQGLRDPVAFAFDVGPVLDKNELLAPDAPPFSA
jgi:hypothetical protein